MTRRLVGLHTLSWTLLGSLATATSVGARAQELDTAVKAAPSPAAQKKTERLEVTGSRIKRTEVEGVSSVIKVDQEALQKSGVSTVSEVLKNMSVSIDGSYSQSTVNDPRGNVTNVNLRGLGAENTLVLLDGRRLPDEGGLGVVDLSTIPMAAVERIEVLKDSASALYGSDATGGVINIITKKDFEGSSVSLRSARPSGKGGEQNSLSYVNGVAGDSYRILSALSYQHSEPVFWRDRSWTKGGVSTYAIPANIGLTTLKPNPSTGALEQNTDYYTSANCPPTQKRADGQCTFNYGESMAFQPESTQLGFLSNFEYTLNDRMRAFATLRVQKNENLWNMAPNAGPFEIPAATLAQKPEFNLSGATLAPDTGAQVKYRALPWGNRTWNESNQAIGGNLGLSGEWTNSWDWSVSIGRSQSKKESKSPSGFFYEDLVTQKIADGSFNPFENDLSNAGLLAIVQETAYVPITEHSTRMNTYDAQVSGPLVSLPAGQMSLAFGVNRFDQTYEKNIDSVSESGNVFGVLEDKSGRGERTVQAVYAELEVPLSKELEMQLAARHDQYSDFGSTSNPKLGLTYRPVRSLLIRGNIGTGFKAPTLNQIYNGGSIAEINLYDTPNIANIPERQDEVEVETYGNKNLKEETSLSYNAGFVLDLMEGLTLTADAWYTRINDIIRPVDAQRALDAAAEGTPLPDIEITHVNNDPKGPLKRIRVPTVNLGRSEDSGYDLGADYRFQWGKPSFALTSDYSRKLYSKSVAYPGAPQINVLGERGKPYWRLVSSGSVSLGNQGFMLRNNIISKQRKTPTPEGTGTISSFSTYDVQYSWNHPWNGTLAVGALNVLNKDFPRDDSERLGDDQRVAELYTSDGRMIYVNVQQTF